MKNYDPWVFLAVFQEMLGPLLWILPLLALGTVAGFVWLWRREGRIATRRLVLAELLGLLGGGLALVIMAAASSSGFTDAAGPADWVFDPDRLRRGVRGYHAADLHHHGLARGRSSPAERVSPSPTDLHAGRCLPQPPPRRMTRSKWRKKA